MWNVIKQAKEAATVRGISIKDIPENELTTLIDRIKSKFTEGVSSRLLWENLVSSASLQGSDSWRMISEFIGNSESILFFNPVESKVGICVSGGDNLISILTETFNVEFYVTDREVNYLFCFNHHDYLIACGTAESWLKARPS